ncbi:hypothetical protein B0H17DRAFT_476929 [Mycena rosella]|uniref:Uncharacterized protein n=1 Tax=Mycena rosella TaxID=1033263 RepID=A0AAD7FSF6_MYCRO|nr:hypothetical protein B0H17DRAFT_476929 [Mycena rosella]
MNDSAGDERLTVEEAEKLGFPTLEFQMKVQGYSWDESFYNGVRQFYAAKGFDPDSQDVALELGLPLYEISTELDGPFAHIQPAEEGSQNDKCTPQEEIYEHSDFPSIQESSESTTEPSTTWKIIMGLQFALMFTLGALWLRDFLY